MMFKQNKRIVGGLGEFTSEKNTFICISRSVILCQCKSSLIAETKHVQYV